MFHSLEKVFHHPSLGILLIRIALAIVFIAHGWAKFANMEGTISFFASLGLVSFFAYFVAAVELFGGIFMFLGVFVRPIGFMFAITMLVAIFTAKIGKGFLGGYEYELTLLLVSLSMVFMGSHKHKLWRNKNGVDMVEEPQTV